MTKVNEVIEKPWGREHILVHNDKYVIKRIIVDPHQRLSQQFHKEKHETMMIEKGQGYISLRYEDKVVVKPGDIFEIEPLVCHRVSTDNESLSILEVSTPELFDVVRLEDDYGRA